jgi:MerR family transcriptional regulator, light-induced transcriptional regulator
MQEIQSREQGSCSPRDMSPVNYFASQVVSLLVDRSARNSTELREPLLQMMIDASVSGTDHAFRELLVEVRRARISVAALADIYIPEAARRMGTAWHQDEMSWLDVSIGTGRLQSLLREIGNAWTADQAGDAGHGTILLIVPDQEQHTLGPLVAMGQMRRYGVSVCLRIAPSLDELRRLLVSRNFDGIMLSVATEGKLPAAGKLISFIRAVSPSPTPIIIGGAVMSTVEDLVSCTGADHASNDIGSALEVVGLKFDAFCVLRRA